MAIGDYTPQIPGPFLFKWGVDTVISCPMRGEGALATPTEGKVSIFDAANVARVDEEDVTVTDGIATFTVLGALTADLVRGEGWRVEWGLVMPDGLTHYVRDQAALVTWLPIPYATDDDVWDRYPELDPRQPERKPVVRADTVQPQLRAAWRQVQHDLRQFGRRPWLIVSNSDLVIPHAQLAAALLFGGLGPEWRDRAQQVREEYTASLAAVSVSYDPGDTGKADPAKHSVKATTWLCGTGAAGRR